MELSFTADLTNNSPVVVASAGANLASMANMNVWFALAGTGNPLNVQSVVLGGDGRWRVNLAANYAGATSPGTPCAMGNDFSPLGIGFASAGSTNYPAVSKQAALKTDSLLAAAAAATSALQPQVAGLVAAQNTWTNRQVVIAPAAGEDLLIEPTGYWDGAQMVLYFTVYSLSANTSTIHRATSPDCFNFTRHGPVVGQGAGGVSAGVSCGAYFKKGGTHYLLYANHATGSLDYVTSTDGITFSGPQTAVPHAPVGLPPGYNVYNASPQIDPATGNWVLLFEVGDPLNGIYLMGLATGPALNNLTLSGANPLQTLQVGTGSYSTGKLMPRTAAGVWHLYYHVSNTNPSPSPPGGNSYILHAVSYDLKNWSIMDGEPAFQVAGEMFSGGPADQVADPEVIPAPELNLVPMYYDVDRNEGTQGKQGNISVATRTGTLDALLSGASLLPLGRAANPPSVPLGNVRAFAYSNAATQNVPASAWTKLNIFQTVEGALPGGCYDAPNSQFVPGKTALFHVNLGVYVQSTGTVTVTLYRNGVACRRLVKDAVSGSRVLVGGNTFYSGPGDYFYVCMYAQNGASILATGAEASHLTFLEVR